MRTCKPRFHPMRPLRADEPGGDDQRRVHGDQLGAFSRPSRRASQDPSSTVIACACWLARCTAYRLPPTSERSFPQPHR
jgi:hypothetical protein